MASKLKLYISGASADLNLSNYEILDSFSPADLDMMVIFADTLTFSQGYEMAVTLEKYSKPTLVLCKNDNPINIDHPMYTFARYTDIEKVENLIEQKVQKHFPKIQIEVCKTDICAV